MAFVFPNLVFETTIVEGTGPATLLGASGNFLDFDSQLADADTCPYTIEQGALKEVGIGTFSTTGPTLTRTTILFSTNGGAAENFTAGTKNVYSGLPGEMVASLVEPGAADGFLAQISANTYARRTLTVSRGLTMTNPQGVAGDPVIGGYVKSIREFGAVSGVGGAATNDVAFADAVAYLGSVANPAAIVFEEGIWEYSVSPNWAVANHHQILGRGLVRLRYTGTGDAFILDGGASPAAGIFNMKVGPFLIEAPTTAGDGVYMRSIHHSNLDFNVRGAGAAAAGLRMVWGVVNDIRYICSITEGGWYNDGGGAAKPLYGLYLDTRAGTDSAAYNTFVNPIIEGPAIGCRLENAIGNSFYTGTMENCSTVGLSINDTTANWNKVFGTDFEANGPAAAGPDIECDGIDNEFHAIDTFHNFILGANSERNKIIGGSHRNITLTAGARQNFIGQLTIDRFGNIPAGTITGDTDANIVRDIVDNAGNIVLVQGLTKNPTTFPVSILLTPTASPYTYTNTSDVTQAVSVSPDQNVTVITFARAAGAGGGENISTTWGMWDLSPGDQLIVEYPDPTPPTMRAWPRDK